MQKTLYTQQHPVLLAQLRSARLQSGLSQQQLADKLQTSQERISKCETGRRRLDVIVLERWVEALGLELPEFLQALK